LGLAISTAFTLVQRTRVVLTQLTEIGNQMVAVERGMEYTQVNPEAPLRIPGIYSHSFSLVEINENMKQLVDGKSVDYWDSVLALYLYL